jgi:peptidoglycan/xylan/chitin deacetylase (PgdA/CDA1 family)
MRNFQRIAIIVVLCVIVFTTYWVEFQGKYVVPIIMYHSVSSEENLSENKCNSVSEKVFKYQMEFLKRHQYNVISLDALVSAIKERKPLPHNSVVLTFDDGYADNYSCAFPILKQYGFPATIFIAPRLIGNKGYLTWEQVKEMDAGGVSFGSHTLSHAYLPDLSLGQQKREIVVSKKIIENQLGHRINNFCYRSGGFTDLIKEQVRKAGYLSACTTNRGYRRFNRDVYELKRIRLGSKDKTASYLWVKLLGYYNLLRKPVNPY